MVIYKPSYIRGQISSNFSIAVNISLLSDGRIYPLYSMNLTKSVPLNITEKVSGNINIDGPTGGLLLISIWNIQEGVFLQGYYTINIRILVDSQEVVSILLPYILLGVFFLALSFIWKRKNLRDYLTADKNLDSVEIGFVFLLGTMYFTPNNRIFPGEPRYIIGGITDYSYPIAWIIFLSILMSLYFTLNKRSVQYLWAYPSGKAKVFFWRGIDLTKRVSSISIQLFFYYFAIIYFDLSGRQVTSKRVMQIVEIGLMNVLISLQYALILGIVFLIFRGTEIRPILVFVVYLLVDYIEIIPTRLSNIGDPNIFRWSTLVMSMTTIGSYYLLSRLYLTAEVMS